MSATLGHLNIQLTLEQAKFQSNLEKAQRKAKQFSERTTQYLDNIEKAAISMNKINSRMFNFNAFTAVAGDLTKYADAHTELSNRIRLVTDDSFAQARAMQSVFDIALQTNQSVSATSEVYQRFAKNADQLGLSQREVAELTETVSKAVAMSGASAASSQAALMQFGQALASGELRGAELNSVMEQTPGLAEAIAKGLGVTIGELRAMGKAGELNIPKVIDALKNAKSAVDTDFEKRVKTVSQAFTNLETSFIKFVGNADNALGSSKKLADGIELIARHLDVLLPSLINVGIAFSAIHFGSKAKAAFLAAQAVRSQAGATILATQAEITRTGVELKATQAYIANLQAQLNLAKSQQARLLLGKELEVQVAKETALINTQTQATQRLSAAKKVSGGFGAMVAGVGGPIGIAAIALAGIIPLLMDFGSSADKAQGDLQNFNAEVDLSAEKLDKMNKAQLEAAKIKLERQIEAQREEIKKLNKEYEQLHRESLTKVTKKTERYTGIVIETKVSQEDLNKKAEDAKIKLGEVNDKTQILTSSLTKLGDINQRLEGQGLDGGAKASEKILEKIAQAQHKIDRSKLKGKALAEFDAKYELKGLEKDPGYQEALNKLTEANSINLGSSKGIKTDYIKQYTDQITSMQQRLNELKANAANIRLFGEPSQYQEVNKLTQDMAMNAEKYAHFSAEAKAKLKAMAAKIDSAHQEVAIAQLQQSYKEKLTAMEFELDLMSKTRQEQELMRYNNQLDIEAAKLKIGMTQENIALLDQEIAKLKEKHAQIQAETEAKRGSAVEGVRQGIQTIEQDVTNVAGNISNITVGAFNGMADAMTDLVLTGKANFADLAKSIIADLTKMIIKMMLFNALKSAFGGTAFGNAIGLSGGGLAGHYNGGLVGFDTGGFTGLGGKYTPAGIVHKGEYVITKEATSRIGLDYLNYLNYGNAFRGRGFANGGAVGSVNSLASGYSHIGNRAPNVSVKVINNGEPMQADVSTKQKGNELEITVALLNEMRKIAKAEANDTIQQNFRSGGVFA